MEYYRHSFLCACLTFAAFALVARTDAKDSTDRNTEEQAIRAAAAEYIAAARRGDADALKKTWTANGDYVNASGKAFKSQDLIRRQVPIPRSEPQSTKAEEVKASESSLRFITPDVAIEDGTYQCGLSSDGTAILGRFTLVWVKRDGRWLVDSLRESEAIVPARDEHLEPLEWLLGEWVGKADDSVMILSARISDGGKYIIRDFAVLGDGSEATATERIAWDPGSREHKSWTFDSQDGRSESRWKRDGDRWRVETKEMMGNNKSATTSAILTRQGEEQFIWEVKDSKVGDQSVPPRRITFIRAPKDN